MTETAKPTKTYRWQNEVSEVARLEMLISKLQRKTDRKTQDQSIKTQQNTR